ncbi:uncharacterized protein LOC120354688 [Nilaparvata lugens]|uniref:uncharacterized protein LOC120354688 n=1 Tax=Nilaparvata lugens TaxID=108931 RepID=UPI00193D6238|nr:uncharacterized protein LOC120354688 [Nilaparvata lugens]
MNTQARAVWKCDSCKQDKNNPGQSSDINLKQFSSDIVENLRKEITDLKTFFTSKLDDLQTKLESINTKTDTIKTQIDTLTQEHNSLKLNFNNLEKENLENKKHVQRLEKEIHDLQQYTRKDNVEIVGIPETHGENLLAVMDAVAKSLNVEFKKDDLSIIHRMPTAKGSTSIVAKFCSRQKKMQWITAARQKKGIKTTDVCDKLPPSNVYVNEHLSPYYKGLLGKAKNLKKDKKLAYVWVRDCKVFVKKTESSRTKRIMSDEDLIVFQ